jgi:hypothetical protein
MRKDGILHRAIKVYWMNYSMSRSITLSNDFTSKTAGTLQNSSEILPARPLISSVINRQVKAAMHVILQGEIRNLFRDLEGEWNSKTRKAFALCFCTNLIICMLIEQIEADIDALVLHKICNEGQDAARTHESGMRACRALEDVAIHYSWLLFNKVQRRYNPVKNRCPADDGSGQNEGEAALVKDIHQLMDDHSMQLPAVPRLRYTSANKVSEEEMSELAAYPCLGGSSQTTAEHQSFLAQNSGRYVSRFLMKFC